MKRSTQQFLLLLIDIFILTFSFLLMAWLKPATQRVVIPHYKFYFVVFSFVWLSFSIISEKFNLKKREKYSEILVPIIRSDFVVLAIISITIVLLHISAYSRLILFGTIFISFFLEVIGAGIFYFYRKYRSDKDYDPHTSLISHSKKLESIPAEIDSQQFHWEKITEEHQERDYIDIADSIYLDLKDRYLQGRDKLFFFIAKDINLLKIQDREALILNTHTLYNIQNENPESQELFVNLHKVNDLRRINKFFIQVNENLKYGGYFVGWGETIQGHNNNFFHNYPRLLAFPLFVSDFAFNRIFPKLPFLKAFYFAISKGQNRVLSKCEILGRLSYCGFKIVDYAEIDNQLYFIGMKVKTPSSDTNPSYGPLIKMRRVSKGGNYIYIYKMRTMHPYAEYLHRYMIEKHGYNESGKIKDDFRVTSWAKIVRKFYLDEVPQLINFLKGELSIVGVRPVSDVYLREYPEEIKRERENFKPGCIPPYVALKMPGKEGCIESERIYMEQKKKHPIWTDLKFFTLSVFNILTKKVHSK